MAADIRTSLCLGQYRLTVAGKPEFLAFLPRAWQKTCAQVDGTDDAVLLVREDPTLADHRFGDGWTPICQENPVCAVYANDGNPVFALQRERNQVTVTLTKCVARDIRLGIQYGMMMALYRTCFGLHGVTLLCGDEIVILSAPSGTGKTTLSRLLETHCGAIVLNGDFALLSISKEGVVFEPTPFCGTSGRCLNHRVRVNRVVFLGQSIHNQWRSLSGREAMRHFMSNAFAPSWDRDALQLIQTNIMTCISWIRVNTFSFAPTREAAEMFQRSITTQP